MKNHLLSLTVGLVAVSAAGGLDFVRTEERATLPGDRPRRLKKTLIIPQWEPYSPARNMLHTWQDRPLFSDPALRDETKRPMSGWFRDLEILHDCNLDGFGSLAYEGIHADQLRLLGQHPHPDGHTQMLCLSGYSDFDTAKRRIVNAASSPYTTRVDGRVLVWMYNGPTDRLVDLARRLKADPDVPPHLFVGGMPMMDVYNAFSPTNAVPKDVLDAQRRKIAEAAEVFDGFQQWCTEYEIDYRGSYAFHYAPTDIWRAYLLPLAQEALSRPENKGKLVGRYVQNGYLNRFVGWVHGEWGTQSLRNGLNEIMPLNPDILVPFEWNEENENTHFQPTVAHGKTWARILNYYRALLDRETPKPLKGDDTAIPNLIVSVRQALQLGEEWHAELLYLPDGAKAKTLAARLVLKGADGKVLQRFPRETFKTDELLAVSYTVPTEELAREDVLSVELETEYAGAKKTWKGFDSTRLRPTVCRDYLYSHHPLREVLEPVATSFDVKDEGNGAYGLAVAVEARESLASVEVLDDLEEVAADDPNRVYDRDKYEVFRLAFDAVRSDAFGGGVKDYRTGLVRVAGVPEARVVNPSMNWGAVNVRGQEEDGWKVTVNFGAFTAFFDVLVPKDRLPGARLTLDFPIVGHAAVNLEAVARLGRRDYALGGAVHAQVCRMELLEDLPQLLNAKKSAFTATRRSLNRFPAYQVRAVTTSGKVWRSAIVRPRPHAAPRRVLTVSSDRRGASVQVEVAADAVPEIDYVFDPKHGAMLKNTWDDTFDATLGGGGNYADPMHGAGARLPKDFLRADPVWLKEDGRMALRFDNGSYLVLPQEALPHGSEFTLAFEIKPDDAGDYVLLRTRDVEQDDCGLELTVKGGVLHASHRGVQMWIMPDFDTGLRVNAKAWNAIEVVKETDRIVCTVNGQSKSFGYGRRARLFSGSVFGGNVSPGPNVPEGISPFNGFLRMLKIRHSRQEAP